ncbi:hypothetical protein GQ44DRAFT_768351 [Phaeosphaeriaceae sp. PMI808]|nr:hypothetical protein GQ44DRAFT_768351 [Phaeosphaeriaceae sp. PMI808]
MPGLYPIRRKRYSIELSDSDDDEESEEPSSVGSKRARHINDASRNVSRVNSVRHHDSPRRRQHSHANDLHADDVFQPGTLVRVKLKNFVTYTAAEFHLGPSLNMVIGPNGTGKSTLVCAICLGLGWSSEHLGRAKELGLFVKNGSDEAEIEIELAAGPKMKTNPIVRRMIRKSDNKSIFWINGKHASKNAVLALCKEFSIQIDNLCQFLPQDRVVEFAKMTDVDRLRETQRAAAPKHMVGWHDQLKELRTEEKGLETKQLNEKSHLERLEKQQNADRDDVERYHQREGLLQKSNCLAKVRPIIELSLHRDAITEAKQHLLTARRELDQINAEVDPVRQAQAEVEAYKDHIEQVVKLRQNRTEMIKTQANKLYSKIEQEKQVIADCTTKINGEAGSKKVRERDVIRINAEIQRLERQRRDQPVEYDAAPFDRRKANIGAELRDAKSRSGDLTTRHDELKARANELNRENTERRQQRAKLDTQSGKQAGVLSRLSRDTATAWKYFQEHRQEFPLKGEVFGPPILECSIRDPRYADAVESQLRKGDLVAITFTNIEDQKLLSNKFVGLDGLRLHDIHTRTSLKPLSNYGSPIAPGDLQNMGFEGYLIDYIQGPDAVLAMLCDNARLNRTAFASRPITEEQHASVSSSAIQKWVSGRDVYQINTRREYGASSTAVTQLKQAKCFVDSPVNSEEKLELDERIKSIQQAGIELKANVDICKQSLLEVRQQIQELGQKKDNIQADQDRIKKAIAEWNALPGKIQRKQDELDRLVQENAATSNRIREIQTESRKSYLSVAMLAIDYAKAVTQLRTFHESLVEAEIRLIEAKSEFNALQVENRDILQQQEQKKAQIQELEKHNKTLRVEYDRLFKTTQSNLDGLPPEEKAIVMEYRKLPSLEALEQEVQAVAARLEMMVEGNSSVIRAYEKRKDDITKTQEKLEQHSANLEQTKAQIMEIREQWEPELDALIAKISAAFAHNFQHIQCAGQVEVYKDEEDFDKWSIQISVRFRESESLSVLNSHRQSGGERAVSTIFYLMALQDLAQSPFRVVDEINQGMDPRNERMVHERMVNIACQERTSQYFLITPKLLPGLKFHPKMKVHIINSGEHVPDANDVKGSWDLQEAAKISLQTRKGVEVA